MILLHSIHCIPKHLDWVVLTRLVQNHAENPGQLPSAKIIHCTDNVLQQNQPTIQSEVL